MLNGKLWRINRHSPIRMLSTLWDATALLIRNQLRTKSYQMRTVNVVSLITIWSLIWARKCPNLQVFTWSRKITCSTTVKQWISIGLPLVANRLYWSKSRRRRKRSTVMLWCRWCISLRRMKLRRSRIRTSRCSWQTCLRIMICRWEGTRWWEMTPLLKPTQKISPTFKAKVNSLNNLLKSQCSEWR